MNNNYLYNYLKKYEGYTLPLNEEEDDNKKIIENDNNKISLLINEKNDKEFNTLEYYYKLETLNEKILKYNNREVKENYRYR